MEIAQQYASQNFAAWPDSIDLFATLVFLAVAISLPALGYLFMVLDFRAYLRSLRRSLMCIGRAYRVPDWALQETPACLAALGLRFPCSEAELMRAYRARVKRCHPDHGGDERRFRALQSHFDAAVTFLEERRAAAAAQERRNSHSPSPAGVA